MEGIVVCRWEVHGYGVGFWKAGTVKAEVDRVLWESEM